MSDGPYRSLPMRHACKRFAKRADKSAFDIQDIADAVCPALAAHFAAEVSKELMNGLLSICDKRQASLFTQDNAAEFEALRRIAAGGGILGPVLVEALCDRAARDVNTVEEHYLRETSARRTAHVRTRMLQGIAKAQTSVRALAEQLVTRAAPVSRVPAKHEGLDDGVRL